MNNKDEKTFADLFSSSTSEEVENQTFSNIFKSETQEEKQDDENQPETKKTENTITFDNIADSISEEQEESPVELDIFSKAIAEENEEKDEKEQKPVIFEDINPKEEKEIEQTEKKEEQVLSSENIFESPFLSSPDSSSDEGKTSELTEKSNPFFTDESTSKEISEDERKSTIENPFFSGDNEKKEPPKEIEIEPSNLFFGESEKNDLTSEADSINKTNDNPFFNQEEIPALNIDIKLPEEKNETDEEKTIEEQNPFFDTEKQLKQEIKQEPEEKKEEPKVDVQTSSSPFFAEEQKKDSDNPFFQGQLNLVENKQHNNSVGNIDITKTKHFDVKIVKKKEPLLKFILGVFSYAIFIFLLLIGITLLIYVIDIKLRAAKGDYSAPTFNAYVVLTGSMLPEIAVNDVVITKKVEPKALKEGDVITFASADTRFQGTIITHRIIKKNPPNGDNGYTFQTRGDNNNVADSALVPESNIYGKVILKIPKLGYLQEFLASDGGWIIVILIPCLVVISYDIVKLAKGLKRKKYKNIKVQK